MNAEGGEEKTESWTHRAAGVFHSQYLGSKIIIIQIHSLLDFLTIYHLHA